jgi:hypothetical protein
VPYYFNPETGRSAWCACGGDGACEVCVRESEREGEGEIKREWSWWAHTGGGNALAFKQPTWPYDIESGAGGLTREVETPLPSNSPDVTRGRRYT